MKKADIIVFATPIWFGARSSILQLIIERLIGSYSDSDDNGRWSMYGKVGGIIVWRRAEDLNPMRILTTSPVFKAGASTDGYYTLQLCY